MKVEHDQQLLRELYTVLQKGFNEDAEDRALAIHATDLVYCLTKSFFEKMPDDPQLGRLPYTDQEIVYFVTGQALEAALFPQLETRHLVTEYNGVLFSPDYRHLGRRFVELKSTRGGQKKYETEGFPETYIKQMKNYCMAEGHLDYNLLVVYIIPAIIVPYRITFTLEEMAEHKQWFDNRQKVLEYHLRVGTPPTPFIWNQEPEKGDKSWDCRSCRYLMRCGGIRGISQIQGSLRLGGQ